MIGEQLIIFLNKTESDGRIGPSHISLYMALLHCAGDITPSCFFVINRVVLMRLAKIYSRQTYTKRMQDLESFGFIKYVPSHDPSIGSKVMVTKY